MSKKLKLCQRMLVRVACIITLALLLPLPVFASPAGSVTGIFGTTAAPEISAITVHAIGEGAPGTGEIVTTLTPQVEYDIKVVVSDQDGIGDLQELKVLFFFDQHVGVNDPPWIGVTSTSDRNQGTHSFNYWLGHTQHPQTSFRVNWHRDSGVTLVPAYNPTTQGTVSTWQEIVVEDAVPVIPGEVAPEVISFEFVFRIKISKIARHTALDSTRWHIGALIKDEAGFEHYLANLGYQMDFYGEIEKTWIASHHKIDWGDIPTGIDYSDPKAWAKVQTEIAYRANGNYYQQVKSSPTWEPESGGQAATLSTDAAGTNEFALRAAVGGGAHTPAELAGAVQLGESFTTLKDDGTATSEVGHKVFHYQNTVFIKLNPVFEKNVYTGTITYGIANRQ